MQMTLEISPEEIQQFDALARTQQVDRDSLVRNALTEYLQSHDANSSPAELSGDDGLAEFFGMWKDRNIDALEYQEKMRREWEREE